MSKHDVIVIGSGIGGLTAALTCARAGRDTLVLEAGKQFGGFINPFSRKHYWFDTGIHYIGEMGPGQSLRFHFERLGILDEVRFRELNPDGFDRYVFPDYEVRMCKGAEAFRDRLAADFPSERAGLDKFFALLDEIQQLLGIAGRIRDVRSAARLAPRLLTLIRHRKTTFADILDDCVSDVRLRAALSGPGGDIGLPPSRASGLVMMALLAHFLGGAYFPVGGTRKLRDTYVELLRKHGATLVRNARVDKILTEGGRVTGVRTAAGEEHLAPVVISNADATVTLGEMLGAEQLGRSLRRKVEHTRMSLGSVCVFIGTDLEPDPGLLDDANIWSYPSYDIDSLYRPALEGRLGSETPFFMTIPTLKDPSGSHAPADRHTVELITFAPWEIFERWHGDRSFHRGEEYEALKERLGRELLARAEAHYPRLGEHMEIFEVATPLSNVNFVNVPRGAIYGPDHGPDQIDFGRFRTAGPVDGLYLCGSSVLGAGIGACVASGVSAGKQAVSARRPGLVGRLVRAARSLRQAPAVPDRSR